MSQKKNATEARTAREESVRSRRARRKRPSEHERNGERDEGVRRRIIRAAAEIYREKGYERAGMTDIARRLGMTAPALYWYFPSKQEILVAFLEHTIADLIHFVKSLIHSTQPKQRLWEFMYAYALWQLQQQELAVAYEHLYALGQLRKSLPARQQRRITSLEREFYGICRALVSDVQGKGARAGAPTAFALIGMVEHLIAWFRPGGAMSVKQIAMLYADFAVAIATAPDDARAVRKPV